MCESQEHQALLPTLHGPYAMQSGRSRTVNDPYQISLIIELQHEENKAVDGLKRMPSYYLRYAWTCLSVRPPTFRPT